MARLGDNRFVVRTDVESYYASIGHVALMERLALVIPDRAILNLLGQYMKHPLVALAGRIDWTWLAERLADCFSDEGRPAEPVRFMIGMFLLKHTYALSDEQVWDRWVHDPYFQYFTGEEFFAIWAATTPPSALKLAS